MRILTTAAIAALIAAPSFSFAQAPAAPAADAGVYQVLRATDKDMTCEQLSSEANMLNAGLMQAQQQAAVADQKKAQGRALMGRLGGAALALGGQAGMMNGMMSNPLARSAFSAANQMAANASQGAAPAANAAPATVSPQQQRMNHLLQMYSAKAC